MPPLTPDVVVLVGAGALGASAVGEAAGVFVGAVVGTAVGALVGKVVGAVVGAVVAGALVGAAVGAEPAQAVKLRMARPSKSTKVNVLNMSLLCAYVFGMPESDGDISGYTHAATIGFKRVNEWFDEL